MAASGRELSLLTEVRELGTDSSFSAVPQSRCSKLSFDPCPVVCVCVMFIRFKRECGGA